MYNSSFFERNLFLTNVQHQNARRSQEADILSDVEKMDILLGNPNLTETQPDFDFTSERPFGTTRESNSQENEIRATSEITNNLRKRMNLRTSQQMDGLMSTVNWQIQRAIHEAMNAQVLPQIQNTIRQVQNVNVGNGNVQVKRPEQRPGDIASEQISGPSLFHITVHT